MAIFFIKTPADTTVRYDGKVLPKDAKKPVRSTGDTEADDGSIKYNGSDFPADSKPYSPPQKDLTNNPSLLVIGGVTMPSDVVIYLNGQKTLAVSKILDGVSVTERISRQPYDLEFECVIRTKDADGNGYVFPQDELYNIWSTVWLPDTVLSVQNTYLNKLGIQEIIIETITPTTLRGSKNIPLRIRAYENVPGQSIIVQ